MQLQRLKQNGGGVDLSEKTKEWGKVTKDVAQEVRKITSPETRESTQKAIAMITAKAFFFLLGFPLFLVMIKFITVTEAVELIKTIAAVLGGIVGMVWGFYFYKAD